MTPTAVRRISLVLGVAVLMVAAACAPTKKAPPAASGIFYFVIEDEPEGNNIRVSSSPQNVPACTTGAPLPRASQVRNADGSIALHVDADPSEPCGVILGFGFPTGNLGGLDGSALVTTAGSAPTALAIATDANGDGVYGGTLGGSGFRGDMLCTGESAVSPPDGGGAAMTADTALDCHDDAGVTNTTLAQLKQGIPGAGPSTPAAVLAAVASFDVGGAAVDATVNSLQINGVDTL